MIRTASPVPLRIELRNLSAIVILIPSSIGAFHSTYYKVFLKDHKRKNGEYYLKPSG
jgi:hypothetical protein